jgi:hypothetical protein
MARARTDRPAVPDRAAAALRRVLEVAARIVRGLTILAFAAAASVTTAWVAWLANAAPAETDEWISRLVVLAVLLIPAGILLLFVSGLRELQELPNRARALPADVRARAAELRERSRRGSERRGLLGVLVSLFRLVRLVLDSREALSPYAAITAALRPAILLLALLAAVVAVIEVPASLLALLLLLA